MLEKTSRGRAAVGTMAEEGNIARRLAAFAEAVAYEDIPVAVRERARHHILDAVGIALTALGLDGLPSARALSDGLGG